MKFGIGQPARRIEDRRFLTGTGGYVDDLAPPDALWLHILRSDVAHGRLASLDVSAARTMPGVALVLTAADVADRLHPIDAGMDIADAAGGRVPAVPQPHLAADRVRFVGEPLAAIVATSRMAALDAAEAVEVEIDPLDPVMDPAAEGPVLHPALGSNRLYTWTVGAEAATRAALEAAAHRVEIDVVNQRIVVAALEPRGILVQPAGDGTVDIWLGNQGVHAARADLSRDLDTDPAQMRVHAPDVGGGFGMKLIDHPEHALAVAAARQLGRPVRWSATRSESFLADVQGRGLTTRAEAGFDAEGRLLALDWRSRSDLGAYVPGYGAAVATMFSGHLIGGLYDVAHVHHRVEGWMTNKTPVDAYRGAGKPEVLHVVERLMDLGARACGLDPVEIRRRNLIRPAQIPYTTAGGIEFDALDAPALLERATQAADIAELPSRPGLRGIGIASYYERTGGGPVERAWIELGADGSVRAMVGTQSSGQGHETAWAQVIASELGVGFGAIRVLPTRTDRLEAGGGTGGSRSAVQAGRSFLRAAEDVVRQAMPQAAEMLEVSSADLRFDKAAGAFRVVGTDRTVGLLDVAAAMDGVTGAGGTDDKVSTTPNGCHVAEVVVDEETGQVTLDRYTVVDDFGRVINPLLVEGQVHGGVAQGIGQVLMEAMIWDADGQPISGSPMDYALPRAADLPFIDVALVEVPTPSNPLGLKGCGEAGSVAAVPAVANAVMDALAKRGVEVLAPPYTPCRVWEALNRR